MGDADIGCVWLIGVCIITSESIAYGEAALSLGSFDGENGFSFVVWGGCGAWIKKNEYEYYIVTSQTE